MLHEQVGFGGRGVGVGMVVGGGRGVVAVNGKAHFRRKLRMVCGEGLDGIWEVVFLRRCGFVDQIVVDEL